MAGNDHAPRGLRAATLRINQTCRYGFTGAAARLGDMTAAVDEVVI